LLFCLIFILPEVADISSFADSNITTKPDRYLMIVTSGGLNQQRTGVMFHYYACRLIGRKHMKLLVLVSSNLIGL
jgi:hypothetical protein